MANKVIRRIISEEKLMDLIIDFLHDKTFIESLANILINLDDIDYIYVHLPKLLKYVIGNNLETKDTLIKAFINIVKNTTTEKGLKRAISTLLSDFIQFRLLTSSSQFNISPSCKGLLNTYFFILMIYQVKSDIIMPRRYLLILQSPKMIF